MEAKGTTYLVKHGVIEGRVSANQKKEVHETGGELRPKGREALDRGRGPHRIIRRYN